MYSKTFCGAKSADFCASVSDSICIAISGIDPVGNLVGYDQIARRILSQASKSYNAGSSSLKKLSFLIDSTKLSKDDDKRVIVSSDIQKIMHEICSDIGKVISS